MSALFAIFNLFALLYLVRGLQILVTIGREWVSLRQEPLTPAKKQLADQAAFFIAVPPGVILHELFHALATWLVGGRIVDFGYGFFWGYVAPAGDFTPGQHWFIAIAGTVGSLLYGGVIWLAFRRSQASSFRYFGLRAFRFQIYFALLYYPLLTIFIAGTGVSDWLTIYNFRLTPILSGVTAVIHATFLYLFWRTDQEGRFEMPALATAAAQEKFAELEREAAAQPQNSQLQFRLIESLWGGGARNKARHQARQFLQKNPGSAAGWLLLAQIESEKQISQKVKGYVEKALQLGLSDPQQKASANLLLGRYALERNRVAEAVDHFSQAIATAAPGRNSPGRPAHDLLFYAQLYHWRSQARRRQSQYTLAEEDIRQAIQLAQAAGSREAAAYYQNEQEVIRHHAGQTVPPKEFT